MQAQHIPPPWHVGEEEDNGSQIILYIRSAHSRFVAECRSRPECDSSKEQEESDAEARANAEFIVRAVNSHDALVTALEKLLADLGRDQPHSDKCPTCAWRGKHAKNCSLQPAREALELAKKGEQ